MELHVGAAVGEPDHRVGAAEDLRHRLGIHVDLAEREDRREVLFDREVEEGVDGLLALGLRDVRDVLATEAAVLRELRLLHDHEVPALGERRIGRDRRVDLGPELRARRRIAVGAQLVLVRALEDRQPRRHAAEHLAVLHREPVDDAARVAERDCADALLHGLLDVRKMLLPPPWLTGLLEQGVVHDRPAARFRDPGEELVLQLGVGPAAALHDAGAGLAQDVGQREQLRFRGAGRGDALARDVEVVHVPRDREPECAGLERLPHQAAHRLELLQRGVAVRALLAHRVQAQGRVADERADVDTEPLADRVHVLGERLPVPGHAGLQHVHRDGLDVREHAGQLLARLGLDRRQRERAVADDHRGGAVVAGVGAERIPHDLRVVVAVVVDEARRDDPPVGLDRLTRGPAEASELDDLSLCDTDVAVKRGTPGSVDDASILDEQVVGHLVAPF